MTESKLPYSDPRSKEEGNSSAILSKSIASLLVSDSLVYTLLMAKVRQGFFEKLQPKNVISALADAILEVIGREGGEDAH